MATSPTRQVLPPIQPDVNFVTRGREVERMLTEARQNIAQSVQRLVEHAGRVQGQIDSELGSFRTVGQAYMRLTKESNELHDRGLQNEATIDAHVKEIASQNRIIGELNAKIAGLQHDFEEEQAARSRFQFSLQQALQTHKTDMKSTREQHDATTKELAAAHASELDAVQRKHTAETMKNNNAFRMLEQRLDAVAQSHQTAIASAKAEQLKLSAELGEVKPRAAQLAQDLKAKEAEANRLLGALQKAHAGVEATAKELKGEQDEVTGLKGTLRRALAATDKAQTQLNAEQDETKRLRAELAQTQADVSLARAAQGEEQDEVKRLREAFRVTQDELEAKFQVQLSEERTKLATEQEATIAQVREGYEAVVHDNEAHTQELLLHIEQLTAALQEAQAEAAKPKKRLSMAMSASGQAVFTRQQDSDFIQAQ